MTTSTLSERVKQARAAAKMSQPEAAIAAGIGLTALRNIEQGITDDPRLSTVRQLERALGVRLVHTEDATDSAAGREENTRATTTASRR